MMSFVHSSSSEGGGYPIAIRIPYIGSPDLQPEVKLDKGSVMFIVCHLYFIEGATINWLKCMTWHIGIFYSYVYRVFMVEHNGLGYISYLM